MKIYDPMDLIEQLVVTRYKRESDGTLTIYREQDVEPILENNKEVQRTLTKGSIFKGSHSDGRLVASIPMVLIEKWKNEEDFDVLRPGGCDMKRLRDKLNSRECDHLRYLPPGCKV